MSNSASKSRKSNNNGGGGATVAGQSGPQWMCWGKAMLAELVSTYALGLIAVPAAVLFHQYTGEHLIPFDYAWTFAILTTVTGFMFRNSAWYLSPHIAFMSMGSMMRRGLFNKWVWCAITMASWAGLGGYFLAAWTVWAVHDGNLHPTVSLSNIDSFGIIFLYNMVGMTLECLLFVLATDKEEWSWKFLGMGLLKGVLIQRYAPIVGGFFNLYISLAYMIIFGNWGSTQFWAMFLATFLAPFLASILSTIFLSNSVVDASNGEVGEDSQDE